MKIELVGRVSTGKGEGAKFLGLPWVSTQISRKIGFKPYLGTLNILLSEDSSRRKKTLAERRKLRIRRSPGYCEGLLFRARIAGLQCGVVIPQVENYTDDLLEVISPLNLRERLGLRDGDEVTVNIDT